MHRNGWSLRLRSFNGVLTRFAESCSLKGITIRVISRHYCQSLRWVRVSNPRFDKVLNNVLRAQRLQALTHSYEK